MIANVDIEADILEMLKPAVLVQLKKGTTLLVPRSCIYHEYDIFPPLTARNMPGTMTPSTSSLSFARNHCHHTVYIS